MKYRIGTWAIAGFLVAGFWALYLFPTAISINPMVLTLARATCPAALLGFYFHFGLQVYWVLLANALTYAFIGATFETLRRELIPAK